MIQLIKDKLNDKKVRTILGVITACALCVAIFPYAFTAFGTATNADKSESVSTQSVSSEKADEAKSLAAAARSKASDPEAKDDATKEAADKEGGKAANAADAVDAAKKNTDADSDVDTVEDGDTAAVAGINAAADDEEGAEVSDDQDAALFSSQEEADQEEVAAPSWITVSQSMTMVFDPIDDKDATTVTVSGSGEVTLALDQDKTYTVTFDGDATVNAIVVPAGATLNMIGGCTLVGTTEVNGEMVAGDVTVPDGATLNVKGSCKLEGSTTISGTVNGNCSFDGTTTVSGSVKGNCSFKGATTVDGSVNGDCTFEGDTTVSGTIDGNTAISKDSTLNLEGDGTISGSATINGPINGDINVKSGKSLSLAGSTTINGTVKGDVAIAKDKTLVLNNLVTFEGTATVDGTLKGHIRVAPGTTLNLQGAGTLEGAGKGSVVVVEGQGAKLVVGAEGDRAKNPDDCLSFTKGNGSQFYSKEVWNNEDEHTLENETDKAGGAILVRRLAPNDCAELVINNAHITGNTAAGGGGIYIDRKCIFTMHNGQIDFNETVDAGFGAHEGGGIVVAGTGRIYKGKIENNKTNTSTDWGGGGIFVESKGSLDFGKNSVLIKGNTADGLGGGVSGCPHAKTGIGDIGGNSDAIVICENTAKGEEWIDYKENKWLWCMNNLSNGKGDHLFFESEAGSKTGKKPSKTEIIDLSRDYYCTGNSFIGTQSYSTQGNSWTGVCIYASNKSRKTVDINEDHPWFSCENASLGLTAGNPTQTIVPGEFDVVIQGNTSHTHGGGIGCNGVLSIGSLPTKADTKCDWSFELEKELKALDDDTSYLEAGQFEFGLYSDDKCTNLLQTARNDAEGKIRFEFDDASYIPESTDKDETVDFYVKEIADSSKDFIKYDEDVRKVTISLKRVESKEVAIEGVKWPCVHTSIEATLVSCKKLNNEDGNTFKNVFMPYGIFNMAAKKMYYGDDETSAKGKFNFVMKRINALKKVESDDSVSYVLDSEVLSGFDGQDYTASNGEFKDHESEVVFPDVKLAVDDEGLKNGGIQDYWFMITEDPSEDTTTDTRVYVVRVQATLSESHDTVDTKVVEVYYADVKLDDKTILTKLENDEGGKAPQVEFANFGNGLQSMSVYGYAIRAASSEPIEQECFVDPKIIKNLEGRSLTEGEFNFKLIEVIPNGDGKVDWSNIQGNTISETTNDRYGMVDFDKANNVSGDLENPSCLAYTAPGTYYYRVVEANETSDPSIKYSTQIITFTTVIERDGDGHLVCTDMYYGHVEDGVNVPYEKESKNPQWHPEITNYAKGIDLQVRKTSALDREKGLEGATYRLYAVNNGAQADIYVGEAVSDKDGWITFEDVRLTEGTLYYFKEYKAPAGHTVSEFRSGFFYLVKDTSAPNGYVMRYTDNKSELTQGQPEEQAETTLAAMSTDDDAALHQDENAIIGSTSSDGKTLLKYTRGDVYDEPTQVNFNKLDTQTHEWVEGAKLAIIDKATGKTVSEWTSGKASERLEGILNVETTYILRELEAPEGYVKASDVEFTIDEHGAVSILSGTSNGNADIQGSTISLYDTVLNEDGPTPGPDTPNNETPGTDTPDNNTPTDDDEDKPERNFGLPVRTGDLLKIGAVLVLVVAAIVGISINRKKHRPQHSRKG